MSGPAAPFPGPRLRGRLVLRRASATLTPRTRGGRRAVGEDGLRAVAGSSRVCREGRAPKNDPALFALALAAGRGDEATRKAALGRCRRSRERARTSSSSRVRRGLPRLGPRAAPRRRQLVRRAVGRDARLPGGEVPAARRLWRTATCSVWLTRRRESAQATRRSSHWSTLGCSSGSSAASRTDGAAGLIRVSSMPSARDAARERRARSRVAACRARRCSREHLARPRSGRRCSSGMPMTALIRNLATMTRVGVSRSGLGRHGATSWHSSATRSGCVLHVCTRSPCSRR